MAFVYILFDSRPVENVAEDQDPLILFDSMIKGVFANKIHAVNEQEKIKEQLERPVHILKYPVCDPALIICKNNTLDRLMSAEE
ncbi:MAG: hypothetical protein LBU81_05385 [Methanosarcinales archaeon]|jgi:hypothetical protein|nr:hypothetical protein [Methanosarcinales archaeon]